MTEGAPGELRQADALRTAAESLPGVRRALLGEDRVLWVLLVAGADRAQVRGELDRLLESNEAAVAGVEVIAAAEENPRIRFGEVTRSTDPDRRVRFRVRLAWRGTDHVGESVGEASEALEIRTAANATVEALNDLLGESMRIRLIGAKRMNVFDANLIVVSVARSEGNPRHLVGSVAVRDDVYHAAALAVLDAMNRVLGMHLATLD